MRVRLRSRNIVAPGRPIVNVIGLMERCVCPRGSSVLRSPAQSISEHANRNCSAPTCREHARREDRPGSGFMNLQLQGQKTLLLVEALVVGFWEASYLMRARISSGVEKAGPCRGLIQITSNTKDAPPNHNRQPTTACQTASPLKHVHILCLQSNSHLARDIGCTARSPRSRHGA
jgi:hypothetical protein